MRRSTGVLAVLVLLLPLAGACSSTAGGGGPGGGGDGKAAFTPEERAVMDTAWRAFKKADPAWPAHRDRWVALGEQATGALVENLYRAMLISRLNNAPEWYDRARKDLLFLGPRAVPTLTGVLLRPEWEDPKTGEAVPLPAEALSELVEILVIAAPASIPALAGVVEDGKPAARRAAATGLGRIGEPSCVPPLARMLAGGADWIDRLTAASALGFVKGAESEDALIAALGDPDGSVVQETARALARLRSARAVGALEARRARAQAAGDHAVAAACGSAVKAIRGGR